MADELARGRAEDPDASGSLAGLTAKVGQLAKTVLSEPPEHVRAEAIRVAAAAIRILEDGDWTLDRVRVRAGLPPLRSLRAGQNT